MKLLLAAIMFAVPLSFAAAADAFLTGPQIRAKFAGRTISGTEDGIRYAERLLANGTIKGRSDTDPAYDGEWEVSGNEICFYYDSDNDDDCSRIVIKGSIVTFVDDDGSRSTAAIK